MACRPAPTSSRSRWTTDGRFRSVLASAFRTRLSFGSAFQLTGRRDGNACAVANAFAILERALHTGHVARHLDADELELIAPAILQAIHVSVLDTDSGLPAPRGLDTAISLLCADASALARGINLVTAQGLIDVPRRIRLGLTLAAHVRPAPAGAVADDDLRLLWTTAPIVAAGLDLVPGPEPEQASRLLEALNWSPDQEATALFTGEPVGQVIAGRPADLLRTLRSAIGLVPKAVLDVDTLVAANFEWLIAARSGAFDVEEFYASWRYRKPPLPTLSDAMIAHLAKRKAPSGTVEWASFPQLTLRAALTFTNPGQHGDPLACRLLWAAAEFAPRLVQRDLVLATALHAIAPRPEAT